ncbi:MAG: hypothetical protein IT453_11265 [Planctomycetes bacterium]|nr:hypothetical protein [Planctomycetota bacterium]
MSRLYYALFQACIYVFIRRGLRPAELGPYADWKHSTAKNHVYRARGRHADTALFVEAYSLRLQADYRVQLVRSRDVAKLLPRVEDFVDEVCA